MRKFLSFLIIFFMGLNTVFAEDLSTQINVLYAENNLKETFNLLLSIPEEERTSQQWLLLGNILQDEGKTDEAVFMYNSAIAKDNKDYKPHYNLGNIYLEQDKTDLAIAEFKKAIKYNPKFSYAYYNLGCAYLQAGKVKSAKWEFYNAVDANNQVADFYYNLAYCFKQLKNEKQAKIYLEYYNKLHERDK